MHYNARPLNIVHHKHKTLTTPLQESLRQLRAKGSDYLEGDLVRFPLTLFRNTQKYA